MKINILCIGIIMLLSCNKTEQINTKEPANKSIEKSTKNTSRRDINGKWIIKEVTGGPLTIFPNGKSSPGLKIDLNPMWKGGFYEFRGGNVFLKIPNITEEEVGNYTIEGNTITFENNKAEKQNANIKINNNLMTLSFAPEMYRETLMKSSLGNIEVDIPSDIVFHLQKE